MLLHYFVIILIVLPQPQKLRGCIGIHSANVTNALWQVSAVYTGDSAQAKELTMPGARAVVAKPGRTPWIKAVKCPGFGVPPFMELPIWGSC